MKAGLVIVAVALALAGCTAPAPVPSAPASTAEASATGAPTGPQDGTTPTPTPGPVTATPPAGRTTLILSGTAIGDFPLGATEQGVLERDLVPRLGKARTGRTQVCQLPGERNRFAVVDRSWSGLTVHYGRRGTATIAISWDVALDRVPDGVKLVDRLPWRPTFAELASSDGVDIAASAGVKTALLTGRALSYAGPAGASRPDTVHGGPELACR